MDTTALLCHTARLPVLQNGDLGDLACLDIHYKQLQEKRDKEAERSFSSVGLTLGTNIHSFTQLPIKHLINVYYVRP